MQPPPRFYADFNAIEYGENEKRSATIAVTGYGTLASLSAQKLRLSEGLKVVIFEPEDIECEGLAHFDAESTDPAGRIGEWVVQINPELIRKCAISQTLPLTHPCFGCGIDLNPHFKVTGRFYTENCPVCGTSVMEPLSPPKSAA